MLGLTPGELVVVTFVTVAVITASWWPRAGAALAELLGSPRGSAPARVDTGPLQAEQPERAEGGAPDSERAAPGGDAPLTGPGSRGP